MESVTKVSLAPKHTGTALSTVPSSSTTMPRGVKISQDLCWTIVRMAPNENLDTISAYTGVSRRQILRILALHNATGQVTTTAMDRRILGRRRHLTSTEVAVSRCESVFCVTYSFIFNLHCIYSFFRAVLMKIAMHISTNSKTGWKNTREKESHYQQFGEPSEEVGTP